MSRGMPVVPGGTRLAVAMLAVLFALASCTTERSEPMTETSSPLNPGVTLIGDSQVERGPWAELLGRPVDNQGIGGLEIDEVTALVEEAVDPEAGAVVVWAGTNDVARRGSDQVETDMRELLETVAERAPEARILVLTVPPMPGYDEPVAEANEALARAAAGAGATVVDITQELTPPGRLADDGVHLTEAGYAVVGDRLEEALDD